MIETHACRTLTVSIARAPDEVYKFVSNPENLPAWATGLCRAVAQTREGWVVDTQEGPAGIYFAPANPFGVLDHHVDLPSGERIFSPMRVVPNGSGSELLFTLFRLPRISEDQFTRDASLVDRDLRTLNTDAVERRSRVLAGSC